MRYCVYDITVGVTDPVLHHHMNTIPYMLHCHKGEILHALHGDDTMDNDTSK